VRYQGLKKGGKKLGAARERFSAGDQLRRGRSQKPERRRTGKALPLLLRQNADVGPEEGQQGGGNDSRLSNSEPLKGRVDHKKVRTEKPEVLNLVKRRKREPLQESPTPRLVWRFVKNWKLARNAK